MRQQQIVSQTFKIITQYGDMLVVRQGVQQAHQSHLHHAHHHPAAGAGQPQSEASGGEQQPQQQLTTRPTIMTFHDLGLNSELQFATFCESDEVKLMLQTFTMVHVNFIGQEFQVDGRPASALPDDFKYPTVEQMAECVVDVCAQLRVRSFVALAVGAGAHIVGSLALLRPDLVHGLFLINPVVSSCSLTEWLCFKMSAIASNHQLMGARTPDQQHGASEHGLEQTPSSASPDQPEKKHHHHQASGLKKLWHAVQHHSHHSHHSLGSGSSSSRSGAHSTDNSTEAKDPDTPSSGAAVGKPASHRLRQLILSRNFQLAASAKQRPSGEQAPAQGHRRRQSITSSIDTAQSADLSSGVGSSGGRRFSGGGHSSNSSGHHSSSPARRCPGKRPPVEYLMYHHFGSASFQRLRGPSASGTESPSSSGRAADLKHRSSCESLVSGRSGGASAVQAASLLLERTHRHSQGSTDDEGEPSRATRRPIQRSHSICLSAQHLASIASDRQRLAYMQAVYKQYFTQVNSHNLWLLAQSFVKRRALSLRKDCGAAAHAAAAAAALGTSICAAFVGIAPAVNSDPASGASKRAVTDGPGEGRQKEAAKSSNTLAGADQQQDSTGGKPATQPQAASSAAVKQSPSCQQALVAGTKVKRTFTCQTLVMCSSVQIHCERALKLMSLLNPLQATWIKTGQVLVLEEKPEKVCQALRLFLQGIGYSMSTHERRLRLSSLQASISSADSNGSARSLNALGAQAASSAPETVSDHLQAAS